MLLKSLRLENIRSYISHEIAFPEGSVLLAGDIGSGKSTILLAIEFALFGVKPGELSGNALLRHGCREGSVQLCMESEGREFIIKRTLKKVQDRIGQSSGYIIEEGVKTELMPKELRAKVFDILNYPESLVSKGQDLIYRFTVYTPQEEMKKIIYEDKESRLDTLRKVFNIDKYKLIRENVQIYLKLLRERRNFSEGSIVDLPQKIRQGEDVQAHIRILSEAEKQKIILLEAARKKTEEGKLFLESFEKQMKQLQEMKKELALLELELKNTVQRREYDKETIVQAKELMKKLKEEVKDIKPAEELQRQYEETEKKCSKEESLLKKIRAELSELKGKMMHIRKQSEQVLTLDSCPLCLQHVSHEHKEGIGEKNSSLMKQMESQSSILAQNEKVEESILSEEKKRSKEILDHVSISKAAAVKKERLKELEAQLVSLEESFIGYKEKVSRLNTRKLELNKTIPLIDEKEYERKKAEHQHALEDVRKAELERNSIAKEKEGMEKQLFLIKKEVEEKEKVKKELGKIISLQGWLSESFSPLVSNIERHVMLSVYHEFNEAFQRWFDMLVEDPTLSARLDDSFSIIIEQDGYENSIEYLSGGEKTSLALAYRLALNKVINDVVSEIKTKDILILDEPTEGFSLDQLDKVRDVLEQLSIRQILIVSHESKIESFVENIIRIHKQDGISVAG